MADNLTPAQRSQRASIASLDRWARVGGQEAREAELRPAREGLLAKFEREVDPEGLMTPADRRAAAETARRAHMRRLALKSSRVRAAKREGAA